MKPISDWFFSAHQMTWHYNLRFGMNSFNNNQFAQFSSLDKDGLKWSTNNSKSVIHNFVSLTEMMFRHHRYKSFAAKLITQQASHSMESEKTLFCVWINNYHTHCLHHQGKNIVTTYKTTWHPNPENHNPQFHCLENLKKKKELNIYILSYANF
jgi:hypothetical protein